MLLLSDLKCGWKLAVWLALFKWKLHWKIYWCGTVCFEVVILQRYLANSVQDEELRKHNISVKKEAEEKRASLPLQTIVVDALLCSVIKVDSTVVSMFQLSLG